jgi:hypothetical protein
MSDTPKRRFWQCLVLISTLLSVAFLVWANAVFDNSSEWAPPPRTTEWMRNQSRIDHYIPLYLGEQGWPCAILDKWNDERENPPRPICVWNPNAILIDLAAAALVLCIPLLVNLCFKFWHNRRIQLHLMTIVLLSLVSGVILYLNISMLASNQIFLGWPYSSVLVEDKKWNWLPGRVAVDLAVAVLIIMFAGTACEWLVRRREARSA